MKGEFLRLPPLRAYVYVYVRTAASGFFLPLRLGFPLLPPSADGPTFVQRKLARQPRLGWITWLRVETACKTNACRPPTFLPLLRCVDSFTLCLFARHSLFPPAQYIHTVVAWAGVSLPASSAMPFRVTRKLRARPRTGPKRKGGGKRSHMTQLLSV